MRRSSGSPPRERPARHRARAARRDRGAATAAVGYSRRALAGIRARARAFRRRAPRRGRRARGRAGRAGPVARARKQIEAQVPAGLWRSHGRGGQAVTGHEPAGRCRRIRADDVRARGCAVLRTGRRPLRLRASPRVRPLLQVHADRAAAGAQAVGADPARSRRYSRHDRGAREHGRNLPGELGRGRHRERPRCATPFRIPRIHGPPDCRGGHQSCRPATRTHPCRAEARRNPLDQLDVAARGAGDGERGGDHARRTGDRQRGVPPDGQPGPVRRRRVAQHVRRRARRLRRAAARLARPFLFGQFQRSRQRRLPDRPWRSAGHCRPRHRQPRRPDPGAGHDASRELLLARGGPGAARGGAGDLSPGPLHRRRCRAGARDRGHSRVRRRGPEPARADRRRMESLSGRTTLLLVDAQEDFFGRAGLTPERATLVAALAALLEHARRSGWSVVHVQTRVDADLGNAMPHRRGSPEVVAGTTGAQPPPELQPADGEPLLFKRFFSAFDSPGLEQLLRSLEASRLIVAGVHTHACIRDTVQDAYRLGFEAIVPREAVGSYDSAHAAATLEWVEGRAARVVSLADLISAQAAPGRCAHFDPCDSQRLLFEVELAPASQVRQLADRLTADQPNLEAMGLEARLERLSRWRKRLRERADEFRSLLIGDLAKPVRDADGELAYGMALLDETVERLAGVFRVADARFAARGLVGLITSWNNPFAIPVGKLAPALACGNAVLWKPALAASRLSALLAETLADSGFGEW